MKRMLGCLLFLLLLPGLAPARGEGTVYVDGEEPRLAHASRDCAMASADLSALETSFYTWQDADSYPCPVCVPDETRYPGIQAWERGGTLIVRVPDVWMAERLAGASSPAEAPESLLFDGEAGDMALARLLHGQAYLDVLNGAKPGAVQTAEAFAPECTDPDILLMSSRHLGGAWYLAVRPDAKGRKALAKSGKLKIPMRLWRLALEIHGVPQEMTFDLADGAAFRKVKPALEPAKSEGEVALRWDDDGFALYVVQDGDVNTLVYRERMHEEESGLDRVAEYCGQRFALNGYADGEDAVYVCVVTDGEVAALREKRAIELTAPSASREDDGETTPSEQPTAEDTPAPAVTLPVPEALPDRSEAASVESASAPSDGLSFLSDYVDAVRVGDWYLACAQATQPEEHHDSATRNTTAPWVLLDGRGRVLAEDMYWWPRDDAWPLQPRPFEGFEDGVNTAVIRVGQKYGLIDRAGRIVVEPVYDNIFGFTFGDASTPVEKDGKWGCVDEAGNVVVPLIYDSSFARFENGCTVAERNGKKTLLGKDGAELLPPEFNDMSLEADDAYGMAHRGENCVVFDRRGNILFERALGRGSWIYTQDDAEPPFVYWDDKEERYGYINLDGTDAIPPIYDEAVSFGKGDTALAQLNGKWGVIDREGGFVIPAVYDELMGFSEGLCPAVKGGLWGYLDEDGNVAVPFQFAWAGPFEGGYADACPRGTWDEESDEEGDRPRTHGLIDRSGRWVVEPRECDRIAVGADGVAVVCDGYKAVAFYRMTDEGAEEIAGLSRRGMADGGGSREDASGPAKPDGEAALKLRASEEARLPHLDGAERLYPLYAACVEAAYPRDVEYESWDYGVNPILTASGGDNPWQRLTDGDADIIFVPAPDPEASVWATFAARNQEPEFIPLCRDAVVFPLSADNPVEDVASEQLKQVYAGELTEWSELGGGWLGRIVAYQDVDSSEDEARTIFERTCGFECVEEAPEGVTGYDSWAGEVFTGPVPYRNLPNALGCAMRSRCQGLLASGEVRLLSVDGVAPTDENIENGGYPYVETLYAVALKGNDNPNVRALLDWLQSDRGRELVHEAGFAGME